MKEIFESYKPKDLRAFIREHNKKVRKAVREETKEFRLKVLSKRLIDVRKKSKDEIVSIMLKNKKFFSNIKKNTEAEKEKPKKKAKTKTVKISSETKKEIEKFEKDLEEELKDPKKLAELFGELPKKKKKQIKKKNEGLTDKQILEAQAKAEKDLTEEQKKEQKVRKAAGKKLRSPVERARILRKYKRLEATVEFLRETMRQFTVTEKEGKFLKELDTKISQTEIDEPELEKIKRLVIKYNEKLPKLPTQKEVDQAGKKEAPKKKEAPTQGTKSASKHRRGEKKVESAKEKEFKKIVAEASKEEDEEEAVLIIDELIGESDIEFSQADFKSMEKQTIQKIRAKKKGK